jgi:hypothetical protein
MDFRNDSFTLRENSFEQGSLYLRRTKNQVIASTNNKRFSR